MPACGVDLFLLVIPGLFVVICLGVKFLYYLNLMYVFTFLVVWVTEWPPVG